MSGIGQGGGNRIGPGGLPTLPPPDTQAKKDDAPLKQPPTAPNDAFDRAAQMAGKKPADAPAKTGISQNVQNDAKFNELMKQAAADPKAMANLSQVLNAAYGKYAGDFSSDFNKAQKSLDQVAQQDFSAAAMESVRSELGSLRERMAASRKHMATQKRRLRALKQLAGRVPEPRLQQEIAAIEKELAEAEGWKETMIGLGLGRVIYGEQNQEDVPQHLRKVVKAQVQGLKKHPSEVEGVGELLGDIHPARRVAALAARQIDGAPKKPSQEVMDKVRQEAKGKHGRTAQNFAALYELLEREDKK